MANYVLNYEISSMRSIDGLNRCIERLGFQRLSKALWFGGSEKDASGIRLEVSKFLDERDSLYIIEIAPTADWDSLRAGAVSDFLSASVKAR